MAASRHSENIEVQDGDQEDTDYENDTIVTARRTIVEMSEVGHYESLDRHKIDDAVYGDLQTKKKSDSDEAKKNQYRVAAGCVGVLFLLMLAAIIGVVVHYFELKEKNNNLAKELNEITTRYSNLTDELKAKLQTSFYNLTKEKDTLQTSFYNLTEEKDTLQTSFNNLTGEKDTLQTRLDQLETNYNDLKRRICKPHAFQFGGGLCYYIPTEEKTWEESRIDCVNKQSTLMVIKSQEKQDFVVGLKQQNLWLGLTDRDSEGTWKWVDGTPLTEPRFWNLPHEPNNAGKGEDCAEFSENGWNDNACSKRKLYICERVI